MISEVKSLYKSEIRKKMYILLILFILFMVLGVVSYAHEPELFKGLINTVTDDIKSKITPDMSGVRVAVIIFLNNLKVSFIGFVLGIIPFLFLSVFPIISNGLILGVFGTIFVQHFNSIPKVLALLLPHGIIEIFAFIYASALGIYICHQISRKILKRGNIEIATVIKSTTLSFVSIVIPLLIIAAFIEGFITPIIGGLF